MTHALAGLVLAVSMLALPRAELHSVHMGPGDIPMGTFCRIQDVCVMAQTEADCGKLGGKTFDTLEACGGSSAATTGESK
jgi:hypothetical protein